MKLRITDALLIRFGLVRKKESDEAIKVFRGMANRDSTLAATLVDECRRLQQDNDTLSEDNARLIEENERVAAQFDSLKGGEDRERRLKKEAQDLICYLYELLSADPRQPGTGAAKALNEILEFWHEDTEYEFSEDDDG